MSLGIVGVIGAALVSTMLVAARSAPRPTDRPSLTLTSAQVARQLSEELGHSIFVNSADCVFVDFYVADVDGDTFDDNIRWEWSGAPGAPLVRWFNGVPANVLDSVQSFDLRYLTRDDQVTSAGTASDGPEQLLSTFDDSSTSTVTLSASRRTAQFFTPVLPADATRYSVTRVVVKLSSVPLASSLVMDVCPAKADGTPGTAIAGATVTSLLGGESQFTYNFGSVTNRTAGTGLWFVLRQSILPFVTLPTEVGVANLGSHSAVSNDSGSTWTVSSAGSLRYEVYGKIRRPVTTSTSITRAEAATITLAPSADASSRIVTGCRFVTSPQITLASPTNQDALASPEPKGAIENLVDLLF